MFKVTLNFQMIKVDILGYYDKYLKMLGSLAFQMILANLPAYCLVLITLSVSLVIQMNMGGFTIN